MTGRQRGALLVVYTGLLTGVGTSFFGCGGEGGASPVPPVPADPTDDPQRPPRGQVVLEAWLSQGHHRAWACEDGISAPRLSGNHGPHRICSNQLLAGSSAGFFPVGAASVKDLTDPAGQPNGFAVGIKVEAGEGPQTWYWYERRGQNPMAAPVAAGVAVPDCAVCHGSAPRDFVFLRAP